MTNPWQTWFTTLTEACNTASQSSNPLLGTYTGAWQTWQNTCSNIWQTPSEFWQTVSAIQTARARSISQFWQQQPQHFSSLAGSQSIPEACGQLTQWCGSNAIMAVNLAVTTQAYRSNLWQQWARSTQASSPSTATSYTTKPATAAPSASTQTSATGRAGSSTATPKASTAVPAPTNRSTDNTDNSTQPWHMQSHYPTQHITQPQTVAPVAKPAATQATVAQANGATSQQMSLLNGTTGTAHTTTSSTANSVMRGSAGNTVAAAAAARRSVVARRATNRRRVVPRTVR